MKIGLTYDLRDDYLADGFSDEETAEFDRPETIEALEQTLQALGYVTDRIGHVRSLVGRLASGARWDMVFNIAEGLYGLGREAQVPAVLDAYGIPYTFSDPLICALTLHKGMAKRVARDLDVPTAKFQMVENEKDIAEISLAYPLFAKPVAEGTSKGITLASLINDHVALNKTCRKLLSEFRQPVLVEEYLPGEEMTVGVIGTGPKARVVGVMGISLNENADAEFYSYENKEDYEERVVYRLIEDERSKTAADLSLKLWRGLGCRDAGRIDFKCDARGEPNFLEINPLAGLHPKRSDLPIMCNLAGISYQELIKQIVISTLERISGIRS